MNRRVPNLRPLARRQRWMIWLVAASMLSQFLVFFPWGQFHPVVLIGLAVLQLAVYVLMIVGVVLLLIAQGNHPLMVVICGIFIMAPCGNLLLLVLVNMSVTRTLRRAGLRVGFTGVKDEDVEKGPRPYALSRL